MKRFTCLQALTQVAGDALVVSSAGAMTLEWNSLRPSDGNFRVRTLGLCSTIARMSPNNLLHIVFDNEVYEASGSKKTATGAGTDLVGIARAAGVKYAC